MPTPVVMPQMGESIAEGTIVRWIKKVGDPVDRDEPLFEISTDKVDAEIPSPGGGRADGDHGQGGRDGSRQHRGRHDRRRHGDGGCAPSPRRRRRRQGAATAGAASASTQPQAMAPAARPSKRAAPRLERSGRALRSRRQDDCGVRSRRRSSAGSRKRAQRRHRAAPRLGHRRPRHQARHPRVPRPEARAPVPPARPRGAGRAGRARRARRRTSGERVEIQPLSVMRKKIAEHMVLSRRTSAHVHSVFHVNFSTVEKIRQQKKARLRAARREADLHGVHRQGGRSTRSAGIRSINASLDGDNIVYKKDVNLGIAVALESGLIVPVIKNADEKNMLGLEPRHRRRGRPGARQAAQARGGARRHVHDHQPWPVRRAVRHADHQPAAGGDSRRRHDREAARRRRRRDCDPDDGVPDAGLRPSPRSTAPSPTSSWPT